MKHQSLELFRNAGLKTDTTMHRKLISLDFLRSTYFNYLLACYIILISIWRDCIVLYFTYHHLSTDIVTILGSSSMLMKGMHGTQFTAFTLRQVTHNLCGLSTQQVLAQLWFKTRQVQFAHALRQGTIIHPPPPPHVLRVSFVLLAIR